MTRPKRLAGIRSLNGTTAGWARTAAITTASWRSPPCSTCSICDRAKALLDVGAGQGVLAPYVARTGARYTGVEISPRLLALAQQRHHADGRFLHGDARQLAQVSALDAGAVDAVVFLLSIQDMNPLEAVLESAAWALRPGGRLVILMTHPAFASRARAVGRTIRSATCVSGASTAT